MPPGTPSSHSVLLEAEHSAEVLLLRRIQAAAEDPKHWRAAAWLLERRNPSDFFLRPPTLITPEQMKALMEQFVSFLHEDLPQKNYRRIIHKIRKLSRECDAANAPLITEQEDEWEMIQSEDAGGAVAQTRTMPIRPKAPDLRTQHPTAKRSTNSRLAKSTQPQVNQYLTTTGNNPGRHATLEILLHSRSR